MMINNLPIVKNALYSLGKRMIFMIWLEAGGMNETGVWSVM